MKDIAGKRVLLFSYGSGMAASMFALQISPDFTSGSRLERLYKNISDIPARLKQRQKISPEEFVRTLKLREDTHHLSPYTPQGPIDNLFSGTYYLTSIDDMFRRKYNRIQLRTANNHNNTTVVNGTTPH